jgi:hypothetical protein
MGAATRNEELWFDGNVYDGYDDAPRPLKIRGERGAMRKERQHCVLFLLTVICCSALISRRWSYGHRPVMMMIDVV